MRATNMCSYFGGLCYSPPLLKKLVVITLQLHKFFLLHYMNIMSLKIDFSCALF